MTPEERKEAAAVMASDGPWDHAYLADPSRWFPTDNPSWDWVRFLFRVRPKPIIRYLNVYPGSFSSDKYETRQDADRMAGKARIACVRIEFIPGQFDE